VFGGDVRGACTGDCDAAIPLGLAGTFHGGYELSSGFALALDAGYLNLSAGTQKRSAQLLPKGLAPNAGSVDDLLVVRGLRIGPSAAYRMGDAIPITLRLGAGVFVGSGANGRTGSFTTAAGERYDVSVSESSRALYMYLAPEARIGVRIWSRLEASAGIALLMLASLDTPTWIDRQTVHAGPIAKQGDGVATFGSQSLAGGFMFAVAPTAGLHYAF
jgi:hypothetical protein